MSTLILEPRGVEIRMLGSISPSEPDLHLVEVALRAAIASGSWGGDWPSTGFGTRHKLQPSEIVGRHLIAPKEITTLQNTAGSPGKGKGGTSLQFFEFLVPCYQVWSHYEPKMEGGHQAPTISLDDLREGFSEMSRDADNLSLNPEIIVWTVTLSEHSRQQLRAIAGQGVLPPDFFDRVLGGHGAAFIAASWFGTSFVGLHVSEGREHYLVVDTEASSVFRSSQLFYLLVGRTYLRNLGNELRESLPREPPGLPRREEEDQLEVTLKMPWLRARVRDLNERRLAILGYELKSSNLFSRIDAIERFLDFHSLDVLAEGSSQVAASPQLPTIRQELNRHLAVHFKGTVQHFRRVVEDELTTEKRILDDRQRALESHLEVLQEERLERLNRLVILLTIVTVLLGGAGLLVALFGLRG